MQVSQSRAARWAITSGLAALLAIAAAGFPTKAHAFVCNGQFDLLQKGYCSTTTSQGCGTSFDASCPAGETCKTFNFFDPGDPEKDGADQLRISLSVGTSTITGPAGAPNSMTVHEIRFDLDCVQNSGGNGTNSLCTDQGDVVEYLGDATITTNCPGVSWTSTQPLGGPGGNEVVFTPSTAIVIQQNCAPSQQSAPPPCGGCKVEFGLRVVHQEPAGSDATPQIVEEAAGYIQGQGDAVCNEGLTGSLQSGSTQTANMPICPSCTIDQCNLGCDEQVTGMCQAQTASTPCADTDGNACTTAGCELSEIPGVTPSQASIGVCVQTHLFASNSTPCADTDGNACTTAGCDGAGTCDQNHSVQVCTTDQCNTGCDTTTGQCTPQPASTPCGDTDGNTCTTAGCELNTAGVGVCVQSHLFASNSTPCPDTDGDSCTTAGCDGQGVCDQNHMHCVQALGCRVTGGGTVDACGPGDSGCDPNTPGSCAPDSCASPALEATHGGQVGAPVGVATAFTPDSACIAGEWTHVRHIRPGLFGNFHARSFDSLMCACLPCPENPDVPGVVGSLCNPGDRICGPEPRRAPANKICFSGAGNYAPTNGPRAGRSVVFRVDVEDRSEPGGTNGPPPPDRYRIRIWFVPADTSDGQTLRAEVACADPTTEELTNAPPPDIDDGGDLIRGNQQIHPPLSQTCTP